MISWFTVMWPNTEIIMQSLSTMAEWHFEPNLLQVYHTAGNFFSVSASLVIVSVFLWSFWNVKSDMVLCFLIHTVCPVSALSAGEIRILYARVFGPETGDGRDYTPEERQLMQKEKLHVVARWDDKTIYQSQISFPELLARQLTVNYIPIITKTKHIFFNPYLFSFV